MEALAAFGAFLAEHADLVSDIVQAIEAGVSKDALRKMVRDSMVAASDAEMQREGVT